MAEECQRLYRDLDNLRHNATSGDRHAETAPKIFMRNAPNDRVVGPFDEAEVQAWYRTGWFHSGTEFRFDNERIFATLAELRRINGPACPFIRPFNDCSYFERILDQVGKVQRVCEETEFTCATLRTEVHQLKADNAALRRQLQKKGIINDCDEWNKDEMNVTDDDNARSLPTFGDDAHHSDQLSGPTGKEDRNKAKDERASRTTFYRGLGSFSNEEAVAARSIFVRNVDYDCTKEDVAGHFAEAGRVCRTTVLRNQDGEPKGCAYVEFADCDGQTNALKMNGSLLRGRRIHVEEKRSLRRDFVDGQSQPNGESKHFKSYRDNDNARNTPRRWEVDKDEWDDEQHNHDHNENIRRHHSASATETEDEEINAKILFVSNLGVECTKEELTEHFADCGRISRVTILHDKATGESRGIAFVDFADREGRERGLEKHGSLLRGRAISAVAKQKKYPPRQGITPIHGKEKENNNEFRNP